MSDDKRKDDEREALAEAAGTVGAHIVDGALATAATVLAVPVLGPAAPVAGLAAGGLAKGLRALVKRHVETRAEARAARFEEALAHELGFDTPDGARLNDDRFVEAVYQGYRRALDAVDPAAIEPLARLTAWYGWGDPEGFFRRCGRFLQDASAEELETARRLLPVAAAVTRGGSPIEDGAHVGLGWSRDNPNAEPEPFAVAGSERTTNAETSSPVLALFRALDVHGLARCRESDGMLPTLQIRAGTARALVRVLGPSPAPTDGAEP